MLISGIDPGFVIVGFGLVEVDRSRQRLVQCGAITTPMGRPLPARPQQITDNMDPLPAQSQPQAMAVEELFFNNSITMSTGVAQAGGVLPLVVERRGVSIFEYTPSQVEQAVVGYGKVEKWQVMDTTRCLLNLSTVPKPGDATDVVTIAPCHARSFTSRLQNPDTAHLGGGRYEVRKQMCQEKQEQCLII